MTQERQPELEPAQSVPPGITGRGSERWNILQTRVATAVTGFVFGLFPYVLSDSLLSMNSNMPEGNRIAFRLVVGIAGSVAGGLLSRFADFQNEHFSPEDWNRSFSRQGPTTI